MKYWLYHTDEKSWFGGYEGMLDLMIAATSGCEVDCNQPIGIGGTIEHGTITGSFSLRCAHSLEMATLGMAGCAIAFPGGVEPFLLHASDNALTNTEETLYAAAMIPTICIGNQLPLLLFQSFSFRLFS